MREYRAQAIVTIARSCLSIVLGGKAMGRFMIIVGLILTLVITIPYFIFMAFWEMSMIYRDRQERPDAKPPTKDEWKVM